MSMRTLSAVLLASQAVAEPIKVDWNLLTDFTAEYDVDLKYPIALSHGRAPFKSATEHGTIQFNLAREQMKFHSDAAAEFAKPGEAGARGLPPPLMGAHFQAAGILAFDGVAGVLSVKAHGALATPMGQPRIEYCVKVNVPRGILPPPQMFEGKLKQMGPMIEQKLNMLPHTDLQIDGESVAIADINKNNQEMFVGFRHNGAPFGFGLKKPSEGQWTPVIKFPSWKQGAGVIEEFSCSGDARTSAAELLADPEAAQILDVFDELAATLNTAEPVNKIFASFPARPSLVFESAVAMELSAAAPAARASPQPSSIFAVAGVAGAVGGFAALAAFARFTQGSFASQHEPLL
jgi:hypothetical protein